MTSAPCASHPEARYQHFCGECGKPTSSFGRHVRQMETDVKNALRGPKRFSTSQIEGGDRATCIAIHDRIAIRFSDRRMRQLLAHNTGTVIIDV